MLCTTFLNILIMCTIYPATRLPYIKLYDQLYGYVFMCMISQLDRLKKHRESQECVPKWKPPPPSLNKWDSDAHNNNSNNSNNNNSNNSNNNNSNSNSNTKNDTLW